MQALNTAEDQAQSLAHCLKRMVASSSMRAEDFLNRLNTGGFRPVPAWASRDLHSVAISHPFFDTIKPYKTLAL